MTATIGGLLALVGCVAVLVAVIQAKGLQYAASVAGIVGVVLALQPLVIPLVRRLGREPALTADQVGQAQETLGGLVTEQWRREALARSLGDPKPMSVRWRLTERSVMDHNHHIMIDPFSFEGYSDRISSLAAEFRRLRCNRLVILGGPGSGKTTLAVQLLLELLTTRQAGEPIPVLVSLARWNPAEQPRMQSWLAHQLAENYPSLQAFGPDVARTLTEQGKILPILDGLDELPLTRQSSVISALNASLTETDHLILTSRTREYATAVTEAQAVITAAAVIEPEPLSPAQAADYLAACLPPNPGSSWLKVLDRLRDGAAGHLATVLSTPLGLWLLRIVYITPGADPAALLSSHANHDPATMQAHLFDKLIPAVLAARPASRDPADSFRPRRTWDPNEVRNWLTYLAQHLHQAGTRDLLWWHLARHTFTSSAARLAVGLVSGLAVGLVSGLIFGLAITPINGPMVSLLHALYFFLVMGQVVGLVIGLKIDGCLINESANANLRLKNRARLVTRALVFSLTVGLVFTLVGGLVVMLLKVDLTRTVGRLAGLLVGGLVFGLVVGLPIRLKAEGRSINEPAYANLQLKNRTKLLVRKLARGLIIGLVVALGVLLTSALIFGPVPALDFLLKTGLVFVLVSGLAIGMAGGFVGWVATPSQTDWATTPRSTYKATRTLTILQTLGVALVVGLAVGLIFRLNAGTEGGIAGGMASGLVGGLLSLGSCAWLCYALASCWLAASRQLPLRFMDFLDDAYRLGLLRTTGPAYQFRHAEFHDHLLQTGSR